MIQSDYELYECPGLIIYLGFKFQVIISYVSSVLFLRRLFHSVLQNNSDFLVTPLALQFPDRGQRRQFRYSLPLIAVIRLSVQHCPPGTSTVALCGSKLRSWCTYRRELLLWSVCGNFVVQFLYIVNQLGLQLFPSRGPTYFKSEDGKTLLDTRHVTQI